MPSNQKLMLFHEIIHKGLLFFEKDVTCTKVSINTTFTEENFSKEDTDFTLSKYRDDYRWYDFEMNIEKSNKNMYVLTITLRKEKRIKKVLTPEIVQAIKERESKTN
jgi:hypothetical protein